MRDAETKWDEKGEEWLKKCCCNFLLRSNCTYECCSVSSSRTSANSSWIPPHYLIEEGGQPECVTSCGCGINATQLLFYLCSLQTFPFVPWPLSSSYVVTGPITWATHNNIISATTGAQDKIAFTVLIPVYSTSCG